MPLSAASGPTGAFLTFGELLKYLRRRARLSQRALSIAVGYSESQISRLEHNLSAPDPATLAALFVPALDIDDEPEMAARLLELAGNINHKNKQNQLSHPHAAISEPRAAPLGQLRRSPLVGRAEQQHRLTERLDQLAGGIGGVMLLSGEPGIGKTRLLEETIALARQRGFQVLVGRCHERDLHVPYLPIAEALEAFALRCAPETWARLLQTAGSELSGLLPDDPWKYIHWGGMTASQNKVAATLRADAQLQAEARPARAVRRLLAEMSRAAPVMLVVDDLHWADPSSLEVIHHLARHTRELPLLVLGAYRELELERTHPLSAMLADLNRERLLGRERLRRLGTKDTLTLLAELLGGPPLPDLAELIHTETDGNPFFIEELVSGLIEAERLVWDKSAAAYRLAPGLAVAQLADEIPQGIQAAIGARLNNLDEQTQHALKLAAVIGRHFSIAVLNQLAASQGLSEAEVEQALGRARAARFIRVLDAPQARRDDIAGYTAGSPDLEADYAFDHPLIHQVIYAELDRRLKRRLHAEVGRRLEALYHRQIGLYAERLAYHFLQGDDDARAIQYSLLAGDKSLRSHYLPDLALGYYLPALQIVIGQTLELRHLNPRAAGVLQHGKRLKLTSEDREAIVGDLDEVLAALSPTQPNPVIAQLASRICIGAQHAGWVYQASVRLYERSLLGPEVQKVTVQTERGQLVAILEFPGSGGPYPVTVLFHGSPATKEILAEEGRRYRARGLATLRVDLPGYGETTVPDSRSLADVEAVRTILTAALAHDRVVSQGLGIAGWSTGAWYGAQLCARDDRVRALASISGVFNHFDKDKYIMSEDVWYVIQEAQWQAGTLSVPPPFDWEAGTSAFDVAHRIHCPVLLVYGALEPERHRIQAETMAGLVPTAQKRAWRSGVHVLLNTPEALEDAAEWMKQQLLG